MTRDEQNKLWSELSEETQAEYRMAYQYRLDDSKRDPVCPDGGGDLTVFRSQTIVEELENMFGLHNLVPAERKYFVRFGRLPESGKSSIYRQDEKIGEEDGVSVFECTQDTYQIILPQILTRKLMCDLQGFFNYSDRKLYLVSGIQIGVGTDNEPVIIDAKIEKELPYNIDNEKNNNHS